MCIRDSPETYVKGQDFDFYVVKDGDRLNVEVTALEAKKFSAKTIPNSLNQKRKQLPDTAPAIVFVGIPNEWTNELHDWDAYLSKVTSDFFRGSQRVNTVIFLAEQIFPIPGIGIVLLMAQKSYIHPRPRMRTNDMGFLPPQTSELRLARDSEFFRWIDYIVPPMESSDGR